MNPHRTIVVADHHKSVFVCQVLDRVTGEVTRRTLASSRLALQPFLAGLEGPVLVYVEACRAWEWVSDLCEELDLEFRLVDPRRMPEIARSTKKTDQADVEAMVNRLQVEGDLPQSYRTTRLERERRALSRRLADVRKWRRQVVIKIHAVIDSHGLPSKKVQFTKAEWREQMEEALSEDGWLDLEVLLLQYDQLIALSDLLGQRIAALFERDEGYQRLQAIPGVGPVIAATIVSHPAASKTSKGPATARRLPKLLRVARSTSSALAMPLSTIETASRIRAACSLLTTNPGASFCSTTGRFPTLRSRSLVTATASSDVSGPRTTSTGGSRCGGLK